MTDPAIASLSIDALCFAAGAALCALMGGLQWGSPHVTGGARKLILVWACGGVWTVGSFTMTMLLLAGASPDGSAVRGLMTAAWMSTSVGPFMAIYAADHAAGGRLPLRRMIYAAGTIGSLSVFGLFAAAGMRAVGDFGVMNAALISFFTSLAFLLFFLAVRWSYRSRDPQQRKAGQHPMGRAVIGFWLVWVALTLFNIVSPPSDDLVTRFAGRLSQHWAIPISILVALSIAGTHYADVVLKRSLAILLAIFGAAAIVWQIPGLPRGVPLVAASLLAAAMMLAAPGLYRLLGFALDRWLLKRPDYRKLAAAYARSARSAADPQALNELTERAIGAALGLTATLSPAGDIPEDAERLAVGGRAVDLAPRLRARALMQAEHSFLQAVGDEVERREEVFAFEAERRERAEREARLELAVTAAELKALRAQVDPHFLFNTLNAIADLIATAPDKAETMTEKLAAFFRYTLSRQDRASATLDEELDFVRQYLDIEQVRFGDRLKVVIDKADGLGDEAVPTLILQPLVENAIRHGLAPRREGGTVRVAATREGAHLRLEVTDDGMGFTGKSKPRVGLSNVRERLRALHGDAASMTIGKGPGDRGTSVVLRMPA